MYIIRDIRRQIFVIETQPGRSLLKIGIYNAVLFTSFEEAEEALNMLRPIIKREVAELGIFSYIDAWQDHTFSINVFSVNNQTKAK